MQPRRPHGHCRPSICTTTWPISAEAPRPDQRWPFSIRPPPTPVPQKTPSTDRYPCRRRGGTRPPSRRRRRCRSAPARRGPRTASPSGKEPCQPGMLPECETAPVAKSIGARRPDARRDELPGRCAGRLQCRRAASRPSRPRRPPDRRAAWARAPCPAPVPAVDDDRLDLRAAKIDAAPQPRPGRCHVRMLRQLRPVARRRRSRWRSHERVDQVRRLEHACDEHEQEHRRREPGRGQPRRRVPALGHEQRDRDRQPGDERDQRERVAAGAVDHARVDEDAGEAVADHAVRRGAERDGVVPERARGRRSRTAATGR